jgi:hypothetical protein
VDSGSLKIARRPQDAEVLEADLEREHRMSLDFELISRSRPAASIRSKPNWHRIGDDDR